MKVRYTTTITHPSGPDYMGRRQDSTLHTLPVPPVSCCKGMDEYWQAGAIAFNRDTGRMCISDDDGEYPSSYAIARCPSCGEPIETECAKVIERTPRVVKATVERVEYDEVERET